jgi:transposase
LRGKRDKLAQALDCRLTENHRFLLHLDLHQLDRLKGLHCQLDDRIADRMSPHREQQKLLTQIPGVDDLVDANIIAEIGVDMTVFSTADRLAAWTRKGYIRLKTTIVTSAMSAARTRGGYYKLKARCGGVKAAMAIVHKILFAIFDMLANKARSGNSAPPHLDQRSKHRVTMALVRRLGIPRV